MARLAAQETLTFDDVLLAPRFSQVRSRADVDLSSEDAKLPIVASNMDTVCTAEMAIAMHQAGGLACLHRFWSADENVATFSKVLADSSQDPWVSVGLGSKELERATRLYWAGARTFVIDVAHGASSAVAEQYVALKESLGGVFVIVGNFATAKSVADFHKYLREKLGWKQVVNGIKVGVGPGCFAAGTRILMSNGKYKNIEDIKVHDRVINRHGKPVSVIGVKFSGYRPTLAVQNNLFYADTYVTPDHLHWVGDYSSTSDINAVSIAKVLDKPRKNDTSKYDWKAISECQKATLLMPRRLEFEIPETFEISLRDCFQSRRAFREGLLEPPALTPSYELGYLFGTFLGDGSTKLFATRNKGKHANTSAATTWSFGSHETEIAQKVKDCLAATLGADAKLKPHKNVLLVVNRNNYISRLFLPFGKRLEKHLPEQFWCREPRYLDGLLDGLVDSDGNIAKDGRIGFTNTSISLIELFGILFYLKHGYFPSAQCRLPTTGNLSNCDITSVHLAYVLRSVSQPTLTKDYQVARINKLSEVFAILPTYDIEVDCETHSFIANNAIVHNSACTTRIQTGVGVPQLSAILDVVAEFTPRFDPFSQTVQGYQGTKPLIIADGGMRTAGDCAKALAAGADLVMLGGMLAGTAETPPGVKHRELCGDAFWEPAVLTYRGSASKESYEAQGKDQSYIAPEGEAFHVAYKGPVAKVLNEIAGGLRSSFAYVGATTLKEFQERAEFIKVSKAGYAEGLAHGLIKK